MHHRIAIREHSYAIISISRFAERKKGDTRRVRYHAPLCMPWKNLSTEQIAISAFGNFECIQLFARATKTIIEYCAAIALRWDLGHQAARHHTYRWSTAWGFGKAMRDDRKSMAQAAPCSSSLCANPCRNWHGR